MQSSPNFIVPTPPVGDVSERAASTRFVGTAIASAISSAISTFSFISTVQIDFLSGFVAFPLVDSYRLVEKVFFPMTFTQIAAKLATGQLTAVLKINNATVTGASGLNIGTSQITSTLSAVNTATTGDVLVLQVTGTSAAPQNLSFSLLFARSLGTV